MLMGIIPNFGFLKLESSGFMRLVHSTKWCRKTLTVSTMSHMSSKKHSNAAGQSSRGSSNKGQMQLTSYLWKKIGMLWKNYGKAMEFLFWGSVRTLSCSCSCSCSCSLLSLVLALVLFPLILHLHLLIVDLIFHDYKAYRKVVSTNSDIINCQIIYSSGFIL